MSLPMLILSLFVWMPSPLNLFAGAVFALITLLFGLRFVRFLLEIIPFA